MRYLLFLSAFVVFLTSCGCFTFHEPEFRGDEKFNIEKVNGKTIEFNASAKVYNGNCFGLKIKPSTVDLYVEGEYMGKVKLNKKVKMKSKRESTLDAQFTATLEEGAMLKAMKYALKDEIKVQLKGNVKGGVFIFSKKFEFNETKTISGANLMKLN